MTAGGFTPDERREYLAELARRRAELPGKLQRADADVARLGWELADARAPLERAEADTAALDAELARLDDPSLPVLERVAAEERRAALLKVRSEIEATKGPLSLPVAEKMAELRAAVERRQGVAYELELAAPPPPPAQAERVTAALSAGALAGSATSRGTALRELSPGVMVNESTGVAIASAPRWDGKGGARHELTYSQASAAQELADMHASLGDASSAAGIPVHAVNPMRG